MCGLAASPLKYSMKRTGYLVLCYGVWRSDSFWTSYCALPQTIRVV